MVSLLPPGERRIFRLGELVFRVWIDRLDASAELYKNGEWVPTAIPSGSITEDPRSEELTPDELEALGLADAGAGAGAS